MLSQDETAITEQGFLVLLRLFLTRDRSESCWVMLRALGWANRQGVRRSYNEELQWELQPQHITFPARQNRMEWSREGLAFLYRVSAGVWSEA